jgi:hypothetical protein
MLRALGMPTREPRRHNRRSHAPTWNVTRTGTLAYDWRSNGVRPSASCGAIMWPSVRRPVPRFPCRAFFRMRERRIRHDQVHRRNKKSF